MSYIEYKDVKFKNLLTINNLKINEKGKYVIYGPSGSGKTSMVKLLNGFNKADSGTITYNFKNIEEYNVSELRQNICFVRADYIFFKRTIEEEFIYLCDMLNIKYDELKLINLLDAFYLYKHISFEIEKLSNGQKERLSLIKSIYLDRDVYIFDEPTSGLDEEMALKIIDVFKELLSEKTLLVISHDQQIINDPYFEKIDVEEYRDY